MKKEVHLGTTGTCAVGIWELIEMASWVVLKIVFVIKIGISLDL